MVSAVVSGLQLFLRGVVEHSHCRRLDHSSVDRPAQELDVEPFRASPVRVRLISFVAECRVSRLSLNVQNQQHYLHIFCRYLRISSYTTVSLTSSLRTLRWDVREF
jgi:hypothetical protein